MRLTWANLPRMRTLGLPAMIFGSLLLGWLLSRSLGWGWLAATAFGGIAFIAWFRLNLRSGTTRLFRANLNSYFAFRRKGLSVDEALRAMVAARYALGFQSSARERVMDFLSRNPTAVPIGPEPRFLDGLSP